MRMPNKAKEQFGEGQRKLARLVSDQRPSAKRKDLAK
jgi:hypothetical protein